MTTWDRSFFWFALFSSTCAFGGTMGEQRAIGSKGCPPPKRVQQPAPPELQRFEAVMAARLLKQDLSVYPKLKAALPDTKGSGLDVFLRSKVAPLLVGKGKGDPMNAVQDPKFLQALEKAAETDFAAFSYQAGSENPSAEAEEPESPFGSISLFRDPSGGDGVWFEKKWVMLERGGEREVGLAVTAYGLHDERVPHPNGHQTFSGENTNITVGPYVEFPVALSEELTGKFRVIAGLNAEGSSLRHPGCVATATLTVESKRCTLGVEFDYFWPQGGTENTFIGLVGSVNF